MHVAIFADQHIRSSGGAQVSMRLQRAFLERAGHQVTVVAPRMWRAAGEAHEGEIDLPSMPITLDREYAFNVPSRRTEAFLDTAMRARPPVDIVHVQGDFWGAINGYRFAKRHRIPVVHTMHNRVDVGIAAVTPLAPLVLRGLNAWQRRVLPTRVKPHGNDGWQYLAGLASGASAVTAPSGHFARRLEQHGVFDQVDVIWNGIDDDVLNATLDHRVSAPRQQPRLVWVGRLSPEKRLMSLLAALQFVDADADLEIIGDGGERRKAERFLRAHSPRVRVHFLGRLSYPQSLAKIAQADALIQTSIGFETQGMTPFEAASLGVPSVMSDPDIATELESGFWQVADDSPQALARTLTEAIGDIAAGHPKPVNPRIREQFRQSSRTGDMVEIYQRVLAHRERGDAANASG